MEDTLKEQRKEIRGLLKEFRRVSIERNRIVALRYHLWEDVYAKKKKLGKIKAERCPALTFNVYGRHETGQVFYAHCSLRNDGDVYTGQTKENPYTNYCWLCTLTPEQAAAKKVFKKIGETR
jgi:hypothetical protein